MASRRFVPAEGFRRSIASISMLRRFVRSRRQSSACGRSHTRTDAVDPRRGGRHDGNAEPTVGACFTFTPARRTRAEHVLERQLREDDLTLDVDDRPRRQQRDARTPRERQSSAASFRHLRMICCFQMLCPAR